MVPVTVMMVMVVVAVVMSMTPRVDYEQHRSIQITDFAVHQR